MVMKAAPWSARRRSAWARRTWFSRESRSRSCGPSRRSSTTASASCRPSADAPASRAPRLVKGKPFFRIHSATAWTTLALTIRADGSSDHELVGASTFPRHWIYDRDGNLTHKAGDHRLQEVVPRDSRRAHALGCGGLGCLRDAGRERARAADLGGPHAAGSDRRTSQAGPGRDARGGRRARRRAVPRPRRRACRERWAARRSPR